MPYLLRATLPRSHRLAAAFLRDDLMNRHPALYRASLSAVLLRAHTSEGGDAVLSNGYLCARALYESLGDGAATLDATLGAGAGGTLSGASGGAGG